MRKRIEQLVEKAALECLEQQRELTKEDPENLFDIGWNLGHIGIVDTLDDVFNGQWGHPRLERWCTDLWYKYLHKHGKGLVYG